MLGPFYINSDVRRKTAWGSPCQMALAPATIDGRQIKVNSLTLPAFWALEQIRAKHSYHAPGSDTGAYNCRRMRHDEKLPYSAHAWATALDWNWLENPAGSKLVTDMPKGMIADLQGLQTNSGVWVFMWGGDWDRAPLTGHSYYDAMHWEVIAHPLDLATGVKSMPLKQKGADEMQTLNPGDRGALVKLAQQCLNRWQPTLALVEDGIFGRSITDGGRTGVAVKAYQQASGLDETGVIDGLTGAALFTIPLRYT
jgi:hypothetical protein